MALISNRVPANPAMLRWARERSGVDVAALLSRFPALGKWERRELSPTLRQLESYARATLTPVGYLFLQEPPVERVPIPDFRTMADRAMRALVRICWRRSISVSSANCGTASTL